MSRPTLLLVAALLPFAFGGWDCGSPVLRDPGFDVWCGDVLCAWQLDQGQVRRVPTWHRSDYGVELVGYEVRISQRAELSSAATTCLQFELQAEREDDVGLQLEMDFLDDGRIEYSQDLASDDWQLVKIKVRTPDWYDGVRFIVRKRGEGRAVLAHIRASASSDCMGPPLPLAARPNGAGCGASSQCEGGQCVASQVLYGTSAGSVCGECRSSDDCAATEVCGLEGGPRFELYQACGPAGRHQLGERCLVAEECATGTCCQSVCAQCCDLEPQKGCPEGLTCRIREVPGLNEQAGLFPLAKQCSPGEQAGAAGDPCLQGDDCQSQVCSGAELKICPLDGGRPCQSDEDCPSGWPCWTAGKLGGKCE